MLKGQAVTISGNVTMREYEKDGVKRQAFDIRVADVALQGGKRDDAQPAPARQQHGNGQRPPPRPAPNFSDMDDDIPFLFSNIGMSVTAESSQLVRARQGRTSAIDF